MKRRKISYSGVHKDDSLLIGNYEDIQFVVEGNFELSGLMYCPRFSVELTVSGKGSISFRGACRKLIIKKISGDCLLDVSNVVCEEVICKSAKGKSVVMIGPVKRITQVNLHDEATLHYTGKPLITNCSLKQSSRMEPFGKKEKPILVEA